MSACCQCRMCTDMCSRNLLGYPIEPHSFMRAVSKGMTSDIKATLNTAYCSQCNLCEMYACQQGLSPSSLIAAFKEDIRKKDVKLNFEPDFSGVNEHRNYRKVPMERLVSRLGISKYDVKAPFKEIEIKDKEIKIMLSQHIGSPAKAICKKGDKVSKNQKIAMWEGLGADIHTPFDGVIKEITNKIPIRKVQGAKVHIFPLQICREYKYPPPMHI